MTKPVPTLVSYFPKAGQEAAFLKLLGNHWAALDAIGLVTKTRPVYWRAAEKRSGRKGFLELFEWKDENASDTAHQTPEVMAIWEPMGPLLDSMTITAVESMSPPFV